jgi:hypothetical protein
VVVAFYYLKILPDERLGAKKVEEAPSVKVMGLPDDLREVMDAIKKDRETSSYSKSEKNSTFSSDNRQPS